MTVELQHILIAYLETHKRLVVPQLGTFLVKEAGKSILFTELVKRDDGVLHGLLCESGKSEIEASGCIDRFVYEVRRAVEGGESYPMPGFGTMRPGPNGTIAFVYEPAAPAAAPATPQPAAEPVVPLRPQAAQPAAPEKPSHINTARMAETMRTAFKHEQAAPEDAPAANPAHAAAPGETPEAAPAPRRKPAYTLEEAYADHRPPKRKVDRFLLVAIAAALIAIAAIAFGFWRESQDQQFDEEMFQSEQTRLSEEPMD